MKKQLLFDFTKSLFGKRSFRMTAFTALTLLTAQASFGQSWTGATSTDFLDATNWNAAQTVNYDSATNTYAYGANLNFSTATVGIINTTCVLNNTIDPTASYTFPTFFVGFGTTFSINNNITSLSSTSSGDGILNFNAGTHRIHKLYTGNAGSGGTVNIFTGATVTGSNVWRIGEKATGSNSINVEGGTFNMIAGSTLEIHSTASTKKGFLNINSGSAVISGSFSLKPYGVLNVAGGSLDFGGVNLFNDGTINYTSGSFKLSNTAATINNSTSAATTATTGVININGATATLDVLGSLTIGNSFAGSTGLVTVNVTNGTMNVAGALAISAPVTAGTYTGLINVDGGIIVLTGDQKAAMETLAAATVGGLKAVAGKTISNTYDAGTNKTTVVAIAAPLGVNDANLNANAIVVYAQDKNIKIQSGNVILSDVKVYDVTGRLVASKKSIGSNETSINLNASNQVYMVKVTTADGTIVTKKIMQ